MTVVPKKMLIHFATCSSNCSFERSTLSKRERPQVHGLFRALQRPFSLQGVSFNRTYLPSTLFMGCHEGSTWSNVPKIWFDGGQEVGRTVLLLSRSHSFQNCWPYHCSDEVRSRFKHASTGAELWKSLMKGRFFHHILHLSQFGVLKSVQQLVRYWSKWWGGGAELYNINLVWWRCVTINKVAKILLAPFEVFDWVSPS